MPESTGKIVPSGVLERHHSGSGGCLDGVPGGRRQAPPEPLTSGFLAFFAFSHASVNPLGQGGNVAKEGCFGVKTMPYWVLRTPKIVA